MEDSAADAAAYDRVRRLLEESTRGLEAAGEELSSRVRFGSNDHQPEVVPGDEALLGLGEAPRVVSSPAQLVSFRVALDHDEDVGMEMVETVQQQDEVPEEADRTRQDEHFGMARLLRRFLDSQQVELSAILGKYERYVGGQVENLERGSSAGNLRQTFSGKRQSELEKATFLRNECFTWRLLKFLHCCRVPPVETLEIHGSPAVAVANAYANDGSMQLMFLVCCWLQKNAAWGKSLRRDSTGRIRIGRHWPHTVHALDKGVENPTLVSELDPDAIMKGCLHPDDEDDDLLLLESIWARVRAGAFFAEADVAQELYIPEEDSVFNAGILHFLLQDCRAMDRAIEEICAEAGQTWRYASYIGGQCRAIHSSKEARGNAYRAVWKDMCVRAAEKISEKSRSAPTSSSKRAAELEAAVYQCLGGHLGHMLDSPLCRTWQDKLWAQSRCFFQAKVDFASLKHRERQLEESQHVAGPKDGIYDSRSLDRGVQSLSVGAETMLDRVAALVPEGERFFFEVQRALIEGNFTGLVSATQARNESIKKMLGGCENLLEFFGTKSWTLLGYRTIIEVFGRDYFTESFKSLSRITEVFEEADKEFSPICWSPAFSEKAPLMLRFVAHLAMYMKTQKSRFSVVKEREVLSVEAVETLVLAHVRYLMQDEENMFVRFQEIPVFYSAFAPYNSGDLALTVQAAMFESTSLLPSDQKDCLLRNWKLSVIEDDLLWRGARQALRNVRRQWRKKQSPPDYVMKGLLHFGPEDVAMDIHLRLLHTWTWLTMKEETYHEALVQGCILLRDFIQDFLENPDQVASLEAARDFYPVLQECEKEGDMIDATVTMSTLNLDDVKFEMDDLSAIVEAVMLIRDWESTLAEFDSLVVLSEGDRVKLYEVADESMSFIENLFHTEPLIRSTVSPAPQAWHSADKAYKGDVETEIEQDTRRRLYGSEHEDPGEFRSLVIPYLIKSYIDMGDKASDRIGEKKVETKEILERTRNIANVIANDSLRVIICFDKSSLETIIELLRRVEVKLTGFPN